MMCIFSGVLSSHLISTLSLVTWHGLPIQGPTLPVCAKKYNSKTCFTRNFSPKHCLCRGHYWRQGSCLCPPPWQVQAALCAGEEVCLKILRFSHFKNWSNPPVSHVKAVVSKSQARLTHISFNLAHPVIITGDNKGQVTMMWCGWPWWRWQIILSQIWMTDEYGTKSKA